MKIAFKALEYTVKDTFAESSYEYLGNAVEGWTVKRNGEAYLKLGPGYRLLKSVYCGICATDLSRRFLPFPLPQITGHEVVASDPETDEKFVVEINDTCTARGAPREIFCESGLPTHCPDRMVLGIDRLPGGFGPYILAPVHAAVPIDGLAPIIATLVEPFAAALHAVTSSPPRNLDRVAVLGTGRLGLLIVAALCLFRKSRSLDFRISALARRASKGAVAKLLGADAVIDTDKVERHSLNKRFDLVYEASGGPEGFEEALNFSKREVHLKSTHGREFYGIRHLTELVVDEIALLPFSNENLNFHWEKDDRVNATIYIPQGADPGLSGGNYLTFQSGLQSAVELLRSDKFKNRIPRFDLCIVSGIGSIDGCIRPDPRSEISLVRPRGAILVHGDIRGHPLGRYLSSGGQVRTSRCGDFHNAIRILKNRTDIQTLLADHFITHRFPASELTAAFKTAKTAEAIKVILQHS